MDIGRRSLLGGGLTLTLGGSAPLAMPQESVELTPVLAHQPGTFIFPTVRDAADVAYPSDARAVWVHGFHEVGDGGAALYQPAGHFPDHGAAFRSIDGRVWALTAGGAVRPEQFGAKGDVQIAADGFLIADAGTDDQEAFDRACAYLKSEARPGGVLTLGAKGYRLSRGLRLERHISLVGIPGSSRLYKSGANTRPIRPMGVGAGGLAVSVYDRSELPTQINAVLILDGDGGRWIGRVEAVILQGAQGDDWESQQVEFGIVSTGSVSDSVLRQVTINMVRHALLLPVVFTSEISTSRANHCLRGFGINKGTSLTYRNNYASNCRDYGHSIRDVLYGEVSSNAVDNLNDPRFYPDRARKCTAYLLSALGSVSFLSNGQEQTYGSSFRLDVLNECTIRNNVVVGLGSDYVGTEDIAVWELTGFEYNTLVSDNSVIHYKEGGLLQNDASAERHHFVYCPRDVTRAPARTGFRFERNVVQQERFSREYVPGWGNNVTIGWSAVE